MHDMLMLLQISNIHTIRCLLDIFDISFRYRRYFHTYVCNMYILSDCGVIFSTQQSSRYL